jgi:hypothetical protein
MVEHEHPPTPSSNSLAPAVLREQDAARYIGLSRAYLKKARLFGRGPNFVRIQRAIAYRVVDLDRWLESHVVRPRA